MAKPIPEQVYLRYIRMLGWRLVKRGMDYNLYQGEWMMCSIKIIHAKGKKREVSPASVRKTAKLCEEQGLEWPPKKK